MERLSSAQAARVARIDPRNARVIVPRLARALALPAVDDRPERRTWTEGEVVTMAVVRALDMHGANPERWAAGARRVGDSYERGLCPAFFVTAGADQYGIVFDGDDAERATAELAAAMAATGVVVRTVRVSTIVEELCDVLDQRALA